MPLEELARGDLLEGRFWPEPVQVVHVQRGPLGTKIEAVGTRTRHVYAHVLGASDLGQILRQSQLKIGGTLRFAWRTLTRNLVFFAAAALAIVLLFRALQFLQGWTGAHLLPHLQTGLSVINGGIGFVLPLVYIRIALKFCDDQRPSLADLRLGFSRIWRYALATIAYVIGLFGFAMAAVIAIAGIVSGLLGGMRPSRDGSLSVMVGIAAVGAAALVASYYIGRWLIDRMFVAHLILDRSVGPREAMRMSASMVRPARWKLVFIASMPIVFELVLGVFLVGLTPAPSERERLPFGFLRMGWPPLVERALWEVLSGVAIVVAWFEALSISFAYRKLERGHP